MPLKTTLLFSIIAAAVVVTATGCKPAKHPPTYSVTGVVRYKGEPVEDARVVFYSDTAPRAPSGTTNAQGEFHLTTFTPGDGAPLGDFKVTVYKPPTAGTPVDDDLEGDAYRQQASEIAANRAPQGPGADSQLPPRYADPNQTDLRANVAAQRENFVELELGD